MSSYPVAPQLELTGEETRVAQKVISYFRSPRMSLQEKMWNAKLIALYDLEQHHFTNPTEKERIARFTSILDSILTKLNPQVTGHFSRSCLAAGNALQDRHGSCTGAGSKNTFPVGDNSAGHINKAMVITVDPQE